MSKQARELEKTKSDVVAALKACGHHVMMPEIFFTALDELKEEVLTGNLVLPVAVSSFLQEIRAQMIRPTVTKIKLVEGRTTESPGQDVSH